MEVSKFRQVAIPICQAHKAFNKVFGIGANKTGTTSLAAVFYMVGLRVAPQHEGELLGVQAARGHFNGLRRYIEQHDAFQDAPFSVKTTFAQVDAMFPDSKFILTVREPSDWFRSLGSFHRTVMAASPSSERPSRDDVAKARYLYPGYMEFRMTSDWVLAVGEDHSLRADWGLLYDRQHYIDAYRRRNELIVRHFSERPGDLLVIDLTRESDTRRIVDFLGLPRSLVTRMPHVNRTPTAG